MQRHAEHLVDGGDGGVGEEKRVEGIAFRLDFDVQAANTAHQRLQCPLEIAEKGAAGQHMQHLQREVMWLHSADQPGEPGGQCFTARCRRAQHHPPP